MKVTFCLIIFILLDIIYAESFNVIGNQVFYGDTLVTFNGIGLTCTEYMLKPNMDSQSPYPGYWAYNSCFGGPTSAGGPITLNSEVGNILKYLGSTYVRKPTINKVKFNGSFAQVINMSTPEHFPIVRIPMSGSCYLYDEDTDTNDHTVYVDIIDAIVTNFTSNNVAVVLDLHWNCPDSTTLSGCQGAQSASMALKNFGSKPGAVTFWSTISKKYANNPLVFYELFNEPWIGLNQFTAYYAGSDKYAGMKEMYDAVRQNDPTGIVIIGGAEGYALDAQSLTAFWLQYKIDTGSYPTNVIYNIHPYQGAGQGLEHSPQSAMRFALALKSGPGPVIFTEFGQYCCGGSGNNECTGGSGSCSNHATGDNFVYNIINMGLQYDISWIGWAWRGNNDDYPCGSKPDCQQPDMRSETGQLTSAEYGGADWSTVWKALVASNTLNVKDVTNGKTLTHTQDEAAGYLVRPCISGDYNLGGICGWDLSVPTSSLTPSDLTSQSIYDSILPGIPPNGNCKLEGCSSINYQCQTYTGPCKS